MHSLAPVTPAWRQPRRVPPFDFLARSQALDLGGGDQRVLADLLAKPGGAAAAEALLIGNKKGAP